MARVLAFVPDLMFGSGLVASLGGAGHDVSLVSNLDDADPREVDLLIVDLTVDPVARIAAVKRADLDGATLAFYSHVEQDVRALAHEAGFDLVVPRSRMAREAPELVARLSE
jgi:hypothetical protein